jgi:hypothetical protein
LCLTWRELDDAVDDKAALGGFKPEARHQQYETA